MEKEVKNAIENFLLNNEKKVINSEEENENFLEKKFIIDEREGLIERTDKVFVTKEGKQLLLD